MDIVMTLIADDSITEVIIIPIRNYNAKSTLHFKTPTAVAFAHFGVCFVQVSTAWIPTHTFWI